MVVHAEYMSDFKHCTLIGTLANWSCNLRGTRIMKDLEQRTQKEPLSKPRHLVKKKKKDEMGKENADSHLKILVQCYIERGMEFVCLVLERRFNDKSVQGLISEPNNEDSF